MNELINAVCSDLGTIEQKLESVTTYGKESVKALGDVFAMLNQMKNGLRSVQASAQAKQKAVEVEKMPEESEGESD